MIKQLLKNAFDVRSTGCRIPNEGDNDLVVIAEKMTAASIPLTNISIMFASSTEVDSYRTPFELPSITRVSLMSASEAGGAMGALVSSSRTPNQKEASILGL